MATLPQLSVTRPSGDTNFRQLALGLVHGCALRNDGRVYCWGSNNVGELGTSTDVDPGNRGIAKEVSDVSDGVRLYAGGSMTCLSQRSGTLQCWGETFTEQQGSGGAYASRPHWTPEPIDTASPIAELALGAAFDCARFVDGDVYCWGLNHRGQLGDGTRVGRAELDSPLTSSTRVMRGARQIASGIEHSCAVDQTGAVWCWGRQLLDDAMQTSPNDALSPVRVPVPDAVKAEVGTVHACALRRGGRVSCWGSNDSGQLGNGSTRRSTTPVAVRGLTDAVDIALGGSRSCALKATGQVVCWGYGMDGSLGTGNEGSRDTPGLVRELDDAYAIDSGDGFSCALSHSRGILCWGHNGNEQLGDGTTMTRARPVPVVFDE